MKQFGEYLSEAKKSRTTIGAENIIEKGKIPPGETEKSLKKSFKKQIVGLEKNKKIDNPYAIAYANLKKKVEK